VMSSARDLLDVRTGAAGSSGTSSSNRSLT
jgi:hypothetical protein